MLICLGTVIVYTYCTRKSAGLTFHELTARSSRVSKSDLKQSSNKSHVNKLMCSWLIAVLRSICGCKKPGDEKGRDDEEEDRTTPDYDLNKTKMAKATAMLRKLYTEHRLKASVKNRLLQVAVRDWIDGDIGLEWRSYLDKKLLTYTKSNGDRIEFDMEPLLTMGNFSLMWMGPWHLSCDDIDTSFVTNLRNDHSSNFKGCDEIEKNQINYTEFEDTMSPFRMVCVLGTIMSSIAGDEWTWTILPNETLVLLRPKKTTDDSSSTLEKLKPASMDDMDISHFCTAAVHIVRCDLCSGTGFPWVEENVRLLLDGAGAHLEVRSIENKSLPKVDDEEGDTDEDADKSTDDDDNDDDDDDEDDDDTSPKHQFVIGETSDTITFLSESGFVSAMSFKGKGSEGFNELGGLMDLVELSNVTWPEGWGK